MFAHEQMDFSIHAQPHSLQHDYEPAHLPSTRAKLEAPSHRFLQHLILCKHQAEPNLIIGVVVAKDFSHYERALQNPHTNI